MNLKGFAHLSNSTEKSRRPADFDRAISEIAITVKRSPF